MARMYHPSYCRAAQANPFAGRERSRTVPDPKASKFKIGGALMDFNSRSRTRERMGKVGESRRTALLRPIATAAPMAMIVLAVLRIPGDVPYVSWFRNIFTGNVPVEILRHLPPTLELIAVSFVVASAVGFGCALLYAGALKPVVSGLSVALRCITVLPAHARPAAGLRRLLREAPGGGHCRDRRFRHRGSPIAFDPAGGRPYALPVAAHS